MDNHGARTTVEASSALEGLARNFWESILSWEPIQATVLGDRRYDHRLPDPSPEAFESQRRSLEALARRVEALDQASLDAAERVTRSELLGAIRNAVDVRSTGMETWLLDPMDGPQIALLNLPAFQIVRSREEGEALVARCRAMGPYLDEHMA